jgi:hypothetical protein
MAQAMAKRVLREGGSDDSSCINHVFLIATSRTPRPSEVETLLKWRQKEAAYFRQHPDEAKKIAGEQSGNAAEIASWIMMTHSLLNLDEALTK